MNRTWCSDWCVCGVYADRRHSGDRSFSDLVVVRQQGDQPTDCLALQPGDNRAHLLGMLKGRPTPARIATDFPGMVEPIVAPSVRDNRTPAILLAPIRRDLLALVGRRRCRRGRFRVRLHPVRRHVNWYPSPPSSTRGWARGRVVNRVRMEDYFKDQRACRRTARGESASRSYQTVSRSPPANSTVVG